MTDIGKEYQTGMSEFHTLVEVRIQNLVVHQVASIKGDNLVFLQTTPDTIQDGYPRA